jgi:hypothetical protein
VYLWIRARCTVSYIACKATVRNGAPLLELSSYLFSKYMNFVADVNLASSLLHKSLREIEKNEALQTDGQTDKTRKHQAQQDRVTAVFKMGFGIHTLTTQRSASSFPKQQ